MRVGKCHESGTSAAPHCWLLAARRGKDDATGLGVPQVLAASSGAFHFARGYGPKAMLSAALRLKVLGVQKAAELR